MAKVGRVSDHKFDVRPVLELPRCTGASGTKRMFQADRTSGAVATMLFLTSGSNEGVHSRGCLSPQIRIEVPVEANRHGARAFSARSWGTYVAFIARSPTARSLQGPFLRLARRIICAGCGV